MRPRQRTLERRPYIPPWVHRAILPAHRLARALLLAVLCFPALCLLDYPSIPNQSLYGLLRRCNTFAWCLDCLPPLPQLATVVSSMADASQPHATLSNVQQASQSRDWKGPDDPDCPYNWPKWKRIYMTSIPVFLCVNVSVCSILLECNILTHAGLSLLPSTRLAPTTCHGISASLILSLCWVFRFSFGVLGLGPSSRLRLASTMAAGLYI